jgi:DNA-binding CsgD family transcriptional regulator
MAASVSQVSALRSQVERIFSAMPPLIARIEWLAAMRQSDAGSYSGCGLEDFGPENVSAALRDAHERFFGEWLSLDPKRQASDVRAYFATMPWSCEAIAAAWRRLETYRQFVPERASTAQREAFARDMRAILKPLCGDGTAAAFEELFPREREVLRLVSAGKTTKEIASSLGLSCHTVADHRKRLCKKLGAHSTAELIALGMRGIRA